MSEVSNLKEALTLLKQLETQTNKTNSALENYTKSYEKLNNQIKKTSINSIHFNTKSNSSKSNPALSYIGDLSMSALSAYGGKAGGQMAGLAGSVGKVSVAAGAAVGVVGAVALGLTAVAVEGKKAATVNQQVAQGLAQLGESQTKYTQDAINASNSMIKLKNSWSNTVLSIQQTFTPFLNWLLDVGTDLFSLVGSTSSVNISQSVVARGGIATTARNQGFSVSSSKNLSNGIYNMAMVLGERYGIDANEIVGSLESSIFSGSDSASAYGLYNDDSLLSGYMANKGLDSVNTELTDAMKSYQRFLLLQDQLNGVVGEDAVDSFRNLGTEINKTKQSLFSFDEVINLNSYNSTVPEVGYIESMVKEEEAQGEVIKDLLKSGPSLSDVGKQIQMISEYAFELGKNLSSVGLPELAEDLESWMGDLYTYLKGLGVEIPVGLFLPEEEKEKVKGEIGTVSIPVTFESLVADFETWLNNLSKTYSLDIPVNFDGVVSDFEQWLKNLSNFDLKGLSIPVGLALSEGEKEKIKSELEKLKVSISLSFDGFKQGFTQGFENIINDFSNLLNSSMVSEPAPINNSESVSIAEELGQVLNSDLVYSLDSNAQTILNNLYRQASFLASKIQENTTALSSSTNNQKSLLDFYNNYLSLLSTSSSMNQGQNFLSSITGSTFSANQGTATASTSSAVSSTNNDPTLGQQVQEGLHSAGQAVLKFLNGGTSNTDPLTGSGINAGLGLGLTSTTLLPNIMTMGIPLFADGGISTEFTLAGISEGGRKEAIIPLETDSGIEYLANAMSRASNNFNSSDTTLNISIPGNLFINNENQLNQLAEVIASKIAIQNSRRGNL